jgi:hypothetical protein
MHKKNTTKTETKTMPRTLSPEEMTCVVGGSQGDVIITGARPPGTGVSTECPPLPILLPDG